MAFVSSLGALRLSRAAPFQRAVSARRPLTMSTGGSTVAESVQTAIDSNRIMVFSKSRCPYCVRAKELIRNDIGEEPMVWELDNMPNGGDIQNELLMQTGQRTVPNIFINKTHIGGCDDLFDYYGSGKLDAILKQ